MEASSTSAAAALPVAARILIADDQADVREALRLLLKPEGYGLETVASPVALWHAVERESCDLVLMDLNYARDTTSGKEGLDLLRRLQQLDATLPVIVMTAWGTVELAVEAMRRGARDFVQKPWDNTRLLTTLRTQLELGGALRRGRRLEAQTQALAKGAPHMIAESTAMLPVLRLIRQIGPSDAHVLITGEHGTGKEVVARALHAASPRAARPMITVNVGGLPEGTFESELFGHVRGAFTDAKNERMGRFEMADQGTLFLDEIANISLSQQAKLLRVLQAGEIERLGSSRTLKLNTRVLSATNADLHAEVAAGRFREDLLFRLNTIEIHLPPLRQRRDDIPLLARHFADRLARGYQKPFAGFSPDAMAELCAYGWPGNVRELEHAIERSLLLAAGETIQAGDLGLQLNAAPRLEEMKLEDAERYLIEAALKRNAGNVHQAARALGISRSALYRRLQREE